MILEYHRPQTVEAALELLAREEMPTFPMGGGSVLNRPSKDGFAVVDLQALGLDGIEIHGGQMQIGAAATLQATLNHKDTPATLKQVIAHQATYNLRQVATAAGTLVSATGRSPFASLMLALDAQTLLLPGDELVSVGDLLPLRTTRLKGKLIRHITLPLNVKSAYHYVARTPADLPIVLVAAAQWPSGRTRIVVGGFNASPRLVLDGKGLGGVEAVIRDACLDAQDQWASAEYRQEMAAILAGRCIAQFNGDLLDA